MKKIIIAGVVAGIVGMVTAWVIWLRTDYSDLRCLGLGMIGGATAGVCSLVWQDTRHWSRKPNRLTSSSGFTLIELLGVIVIMALIAAIGIPAMKAMQGTALQTAARQFSNAMILARQYSINMRTPVRVALAVDMTTMGTGSSNLICRAYGVYYASNDLNGAVAAWLPLQDWRTLPPGVVFSDHNCTSYNSVTLDPVPPAGVNTRTLGTGGTLTAWEYFNNCVTMPVITNITTNVIANLTLSTVEFRPTGLPNIPGTPIVGGIRLGLGAVTDPPTRKILLNNMNNWVNVEYDSRGGRVRIRHPESYQ